MSLEALMGYLRMNAERADDWVPVTERLPEAFKTVLVSASFVGVTTSYYYGGEWLQIGARAHVTHWRDLPEPPKGAP